MPASKSIARMKEAMGMNTYEAKIWSSLLARGIASASELADISNVPRSRCYDVLEGLEKKGFVFQKIGKPIKYIANSPEEVMRILQKGIRKEEDRLMSLYEELRGTEVFNELKNMYSRGGSFVDGNDMSTSIVGRADINIFLRGMLSRASKEAIIHSTDDGIRRKMRIAKKALKNGISLRVYSSGIKELAGSRASIHARRSSLRFVQADNELLIFTSPEDVPAEHETAVWVQSDYMSGMLREMLR